MIRLPFLILVFFVSADAQVFAIKTGAVSLEPFLSEIGYSLSVSVTPTRHLVEASLSALHFRSGLSVLESFVSMPHAIYDKEFFVLLVPSLGMSWVNGLHLFGSDKNRTAGFFKIEIRLVDNIPFSGIFDFGYKSSRVVGTHDVWISSWTFSYGFQLNVRDS